MEGDIADQVRELLAAVPEPAPAGYDSKLGRWFQWCAERGCEPVPVDPARLVEYVNEFDLSAQRSLEGHFSAINWLNRKLGGESLTYHPEVRESYRKTKARLNPPRSVDALTYETLLKVVAPLGPRAADVRDRAILTMGWSTPLKSGEMEKLRWGDVRVTDQGLRVTVSGNGSVDVPSQPWEPETCPKVAYEAYADAMRTAVGPMFVAIDRHENIGSDALSARAFRGIIKRRAEDVGLDPSRFSGESLRRGGDRQRERESKDAERALWRQKRDRAREAAAKSAGGEYPKLLKRARDLERELGRIYPDATPSERRHLDDAKVGMVRLFDGLDKAARVVGE